MATWTLAQLEAVEGKPIYLFSIYNPNTQTFHDVTLEELPVTAINFFLNKLSLHVPPPA